MKQVLDLKKERELLSTGCKKLWDRKMQDIEKIAVQLNMTKAEKNGLIQRTAAEIIYGDLKAYNNYLQKSGDELAKRKIKKNNLEMQRVSHVYDDHAKDVERIRQPAAQLMARADNALATENKGRTY